jgi:hypothetical protein
MANILEFFGYDPNDRSREAVHARSQFECPFLQSRCTKKLHDGEAGGACTLERKDGAVIICPIRLYANDYQVLHDVSDQAFEPGLELVVASEIDLFMRENPGEPCVAVFGHRWGKELRLPNRDKEEGGSYFVDWVLAHMSPAHELLSFVAIEVQSIDTTGNYREERQAYLDGVPFEGHTSAGFNWENVNKRILPQIIYKGHVLRREPLCHKGLFFICPDPVYEKIAERLGGNLDTIHPHPGSVTLMRYDVGGPVPPGEIRSLRLVGQSTVTVDTIALAFTAPKNLPPHRVYEKAIREEL